MTATGTPQLAAEHPKRRLDVIRELGSQLGHVSIELWRARVVFIFTFIFPLTWLVLLGMLAGNDVVDSSSGVRLMQFMVPTAAAMGVLYGTFPTVAASLAVARERGTVKRVRGTPLPAWIYLAGRLGGAAIFATGAVLTMLAVGVVAYDLQIVWRTVPATLVTIIVAIGCFTAAGLAAASLARSAGMAQTASVAAAVILSFISGLYTPAGQLPEWARTVADVFPLKPFVDALQDQFNPYGTGPGWDLRALGVMAAWGLVAGVVAARTFRWSPGHSRRASRRRERRQPSVPATLPPFLAGADVTTRKGSRAAQLWGQIGHVLVSARRDPGWVFFAVAMPAALFAFLMWTIAPNESLADGVPFGIALAAGMITWGTAVTAFVNTPEAVARQRDSGTLKRLRGTPLRQIDYFVGRIAAAVVIALLTATVILVLGGVVFDVPFDWFGIPLAVAVLGLGTTTIAACGFLLAAVVPSSSAVTAVGLAILLPVAFFSGVFTIGLTPDWMAAIGSMLPMKPVADLLAAALDPTGPPIELFDLATLFAWLVVAGLFAGRPFRWNRHSGTANSPRR